MSEPSPSLVESHMALVQASRQKAAAEAAVDAGAVIEKDVKLVGLECKEEDADEVIADAAAAAVASKKRSILDEDEEKESNKKLRTSDRIIIEGMEISMTVEEISNLYCNVVPEVAILTLLREPKTWQHDEIMLLFSDIETKLGGSDKLMAQIYLPHAEREAGYIDKVIACAVAHMRFTGDPLRPEHLVVCELSNVNVGSSHAIYLY